VTATGSQKTVFLVNPASANGTTGKRWPETARRAAAAGLQGDTLFSERPGHLAELAREAALAGASLLVVVGGDGSLNEVANGLAELSRAPELAEPPELAIIPRGTGWDFVRTFGIPRDVEAAVGVALRGDVRTIDLGRVTYRAWDGREADAAFANVASAGMSGAVAQRANGTSKAFGGKASYLWATFAVFAGWSAVEAHVVVDGEVRQGRMFDVIVANGRYFGGGMKMCPVAEPDDGLFDVVTIGDVTKRDLVATLPKIYRGTHLPHPKAELLRGRSVSIKTAEPVPVQLDGEQPGTTPARFEALPGALRLRVPAMSPH
jgi:diacylglycerol kinase (ATP)